MRRGRRQPPVPAIRGNSAPAPFLAGAADDSRFGAAQFECGRKMAETMGRETGLSLAALQPATSPLLAGELMARTQDPSLIMSGRLARSGVELLFLLDPDDCEKLLLFACGGNFRKGGNDFRQLFRPGGKALLSEIGLFFMKGCADGWGSLFEGESPEIGEVWTNPASCRFFGHDEPLALVSFPLSADGGTITPKTALSMSSLARVAPVFGMPGNFRVSAPVFRKGEKPASAGFWERLKALFGVSREEKIVVFRELADRGATVCSLALADEHPQLTAAVLSTFPEHLAKSVLERLPMDTRRDIIGRMSHVIIRQAALLLPVEKALTEKVENLQILESSVSWR